MNEGGVYHGASSAPPRASRMVGRKELLERAPGLDVALYDAADAAFPVRVTRSFLERDPDPEGPLLRQVLPDPAELRSDATDRDDPVGDARMSPVPWVVRKHRDRVLLLLTKRCHLYCRYCFRRNHDPGEGSDPTESEWQAAVDYARESGAREVILSGGDPLAVTDARLFATLDALQPHIPVVRVHTRAPITLPERVTEALVSGLRARAPVWVVVHANHSSELSSEVAEALSRLVDAGVPVLNQAVLLRGVNDDVEVLAALCERLVALRVFPYYLHHPDHAAGNAHFRVDAREGLALWYRLQRRVSGIALPRYVIDKPDGSGKIDVAEWLGGAEPAR